MGNRFAVRSKCLTWPNVRTQMGVNESIGVNHSSSDGRVPFDLTDPNEGRENDDDYRRSNENNDHGCINDRANEQDWQNAVRRDSEAGGLYDNPVNNLYNEPVRDYLFEDWEAMKNETWSTAEE